MMILSHSIRLKPNVKQSIALAKAAGCARYTWNWALAEWERQYEAGEKPSANKLKKQFNEIKETLCPWIYESPKDANQQPFADLGQGWSNYFASLKGTRKGPRMAKPKFKKRGEHDAFYVSNDKFNFPKPRVVKLPVIGNVKMHEALRFKGKILSARVVRTADHWDLVVQVEGDFKQEVSENRRDIVGVDLGVNTAIVTSAYDFFKSPKPLKHELRSLKRAQRKLSRRVKGSKNREKARRIVARKHERIANIRNDFAQKKTTKISRENQAVVLEDLNVKGMLKGNGARGVADIAFRMIRGMFEYKQSIYGTKVIAADRFFASSKKCSRCGHEKIKLGRGETVYVCEKCGHVVNRDLNAARNLEKYLRLEGNWQKKTPTPVESTWLAPVVGVTSLAGTSSSREAGINRDRERSLAITN